MTTNARHRNARPISAQRGDQCISSNARRPRPHDEQMHQPPAQQLGNQCERPRRHDVTLSEHAAPPWSHRYPTGSCRGRSQGIAVVGAVAAWPQETIGGVRSQSSTSEDWCRAAGVRRDRRPTPRPQGCKIRSGCRRTCQRRPSATGLLLSSTRASLQNSHFESAHQLREPPLSGGLSVSRKSAHGFLRIDHDVEDFRCR